MKQIGSNIEQIQTYIEKQTNHSPDIIYRDISFFKYQLKLIYSESLASSDSINQFVLRFLEQKKMHGKKGVGDLLTYLEQNIPVHKVNRVCDYKDLFYQLFSGFLILCVDGKIEALSFETKASLDSGITAAQNEIVIKGPKDAFSENYQTNVGLIRKRIRSENLWIHETKVGKRSETKVGVFYINGITDQQLVKHVTEKIDQINIDAVGDSNYITEMITENETNVFPTSFSTERPDLVTKSLLEGKIAIVVENSQMVIVMPLLFSEFFQSTEDYYQKPANANYTRVIRFLAFLITILTPAIYLAVTTYNHEAIPSKLLVNLAIQRDGVPFPTFIEALLMLATFEILKETDTRTPSVIGSSLSIVGALVLGDAAVTAGIVSPIMVIVISITSISGFIISNFDVINGVRWWRLIFFVFSGFAGIIGIVVAGLLFIINLTSTKALGLPYTLPISPLQLENLGDDILLTNKMRFFKRKSYYSKNRTRGRE